MWTDCSPPPNFSDTEVVTNELETILRPCWERAGLLLIAALLFCLITRIFTPKWSGYWKSSDTVTGFYELDEDSIDTLIIGSSQVISGISPMELYQSAGISAYSLGTEQQPVLCSYYLLREALDTQPNLKAVIFEVTELFNVCSEASYRKGLDYLPLNAAKWEAIQTHVAWAEKREAEENGETAPSALSYVPAYHRLPRPVEPVGTSGFHLLAAGSHRPLSGLLHPDQPGRRGCL